MTRSRISRTDAAAVAVDAFVFGYPLVLSDRMRIWMTAAPPCGPGGMRAPLNEFVHARGTPDAGTAAAGGHLVAALRSSAWVDLGDGPVVLEVPDAHGRFYAMSMVDLWTNTFASVGARTTGTRRRAYVINGPRSPAGAHPGGMAPIAAPTRVIRISGLTQGNAIDGFAAAHAVQDGFRLFRLGERPGTISAAAPGSCTADRRLPVEQVERMDAQTFFTALGRLIRDNPPRLEDLPLIDRMRRLGLLLEADGDWARLGELVPAVEQGARRGLELVMEMAEAPPGELVGDWRIRFQLGSFGTDYLARAGAACAGLEAGSAADLLPALVRTSADGRPLTGRRRYVLRFPPGAVPPVHGFWTLTTYDDRLSLVDNPVDSYATGDWNGLTFDGDGSLRIHIQHGRPPAEGPSNWLPAPPGPFNLLLRLIWPTTDALDRSWRPPAVTPLE